MFKFFATVMITNNKQKPQQQRQQQQLMENIHHVISAPDYGANYQRQTD